MKEPEIDKNGVFVFPDCNTVTYHEETCHQPTQISNSSSFSTSFPQKVTTSVNENTKIIHPTGARYLGCDSNFVTLSNANNVSSDSLFQNAVKKSDNCGSPKKTVVDESCDFITLCNVHNSETRNLANSINNSSLPFMTPNQSRYNANIHKISKQKNNSNYLSCVNKDYRLPIMEFKNGNGHHKHKFSKTVAPKTLCDNLPDISQSSSSICKNSIQMNYTNHELEDTHEVLRLLDSDIKVS